MYPPKVFHYYQYIEWIAAGLHYSMPRRSTHTYRCYNWFAQRYIWL